MKKYLMFLALLMLLPLVFAQESVTEDPGVTPDSFLWGVDRALEQISLLLAANPEAKAVKGLEIAQERLLEVKAMAEERNLPALEKAQKAHHKVLLRVKENVQLLDDEDPEALLEKELELDKKLLAHQEQVAEVEAKLKVKIKVEGALSAEQQAKLDEFLASLGESAEEVEVEIKNKKDKTKIRIKEKTGKSEEEIEDEVEKLEREKGLLEEKIKVRAETFEGKSSVKVELKFDTSTTDKEALLAEIAEKFSLDADLAASLLKVEEEEDQEEAEAEERLRVKVKIDEQGSDVTVKLRFSVDSADTAEIVNAIVEKTQLTAQQVEGVWKVKEEKPEEEKELEIEVEIEEGEAEVKVKTDGSEMEFVLQETDREKMVQEIAVRLGISVDEVLKYVSFEEENEDKDDGDVGDKDEGNVNDKSGKKNLRGEAIKGSNSDSGKSDSKKGDDD